MGIWITAIERKCRMQRIWIHSNDQKCYDDCGVVLLNDTYIVVIRVFKLDEIDLEFELLNWVQANATSYCLVGGGWPIHEENEPQRFKFMWLPPAAIFLWLRSRSILKGLGRQGALDLLLRNLIWFKSLMIDLTSGRQISIENLSFECFISKCVQLKFH